VPKDELETDIPDRIPVRTYDAHVRQQAAPPMQPLTFTDTTLDNGLRVIIAKIITRLSTPSRSATR